MRLRKKSMTCRELVDVITAYLEGAMTGGNRKRFERHVAACAGCTNYLEQMRTVIRLAGRITEEAIPPAARDELLTEFRGWKAGR